MSTFEPRWRSCGPRLLARMTGLPPWACAEYTDTQPDGTTTPTGMEKAIRDLMGGDVRSVEDASLGDLSQWLMSGWRVVVLWWSELPPGPPDGHWSEVLWVNRHNQEIVLSDPDFNEPRHIPLAHFDAHWIDGDGERDYVRLAILRRGT